MNSLWRLSHKLYGMGRMLRPLARLFEILQQVIYSNAISSMCEIGEGTVFLHHGMGCTVHMNAKIGVNYEIFTNSVLGDNWSGCVRTGKAPSVGDNVMIGTGAVILGEVTIGDRCIIGANTVITKDIPPGSLVVGSNRILKRDNRAV